MKSRVLGGIEDYLKYRPDFKATATTTLQIWLFNLDEELAGFSSMIKNQLDPGIRTELVREAQYLKTIRCAIVDELDSRFLHR